MIVFPQGNVLIDNHGTACLTDFGLSVISDFVGTSYLKSAICGGVQFADPALVQRAESSQSSVFYPTEPCDVYSFGGIMLHVCKSILLHDLMSDMSLIGPVWEETIRWNSFKFHFLDSFEGRTAPDTDSGKAYHSLAQVVDPKVLGS